MNGEACQAIIHFGPDLVILISEEINMIFNWSCIILASLFKNKQEDKAYFNCISQLWIYFLKLFVDVIQQVKCWDHFKCLKAIKTKSIKMHSKAKFVNVIVKLMLYNKNLSGPYY